MKNLLEEHRTKREKAIAEHKQNELLRLKQEKQTWYNQFVSRVYAWHENHPYENTVNNLWYRTFSITPQELINNEINAIQAIKRSWGGVVQPAYYFSPIQFEYTQQAKNLETEKAGIQQILRNEFIDILHKLYPNWYPVNFKDWPDDWGKTVINGRNFEAIEQQLPTYRRQLAEKIEAERLEAQRLEAERLQAEKMELERLELERIKAEQLKAQKLEEERLQAEKLKTQKLEEERLQAEQLELERLELERVEVEQLETQRLEAEKLEAELGIGVSNNHDFVEVQLQSSFYDEYFQWSAEYQYDPSMFLK